MSKYLKLWEYIQSRNEEEFKLSFDEIKEVLGFSIDHSFLNYKKELNEYGYSVLKISLKQETVAFKKL